MTDGSSPALSPAGHRRTLGLLLALSVVALFWDIGRRDLWKPDETRYALIAQEMIATGECLIPHANGDVYSEKPPMFFWLIGAAAKATGGTVTETSARLPSALSTLGIILVLWAFARRVFGGETALLACVIFATSLVALGLSHAVFLDMPFTFFMTLGLCAMYAGYVGMPAPTPETGSAPAPALTPREAALAASPGSGALGWMCLGFAALALAALVKLHGIILPPLVIVVFCAFAGQYHRLLNPRQLAGVAVAAAILLAWYLPVRAEAPPEYLENLIFGQIKRRVLEPDEKVHSPVYFLYVFPGLFLPWVVFLPTAVVHLLRERYRLGREGVWFCIAWMVTIFAFFSAVPSKGPLYVLPMVPAAALTVAVLWREYLSGPAAERVEKWIRWPLGVLGVFLALAGPIAYFILRDKYPNEIVQAMAPLLVVGCGGVLLLVLSFFPAPRIQFVAVAAFQIILLVVSLRYLVPILDPNRSNRRGMEEVMSVVGDRDLISYRLPDHLVFYTRRVPLPFIQTPAELAGAMGRTEQVYAMMDETEYRDLKARRTMPLELVRTVKAANKTISLVTNRPP
ncbi:MAG: glycosyltransferase family 39 protein [Planctomycetes bacterium]|nr:glycosyltransferase family 39 protein [Planctomycetota bacterium]